MEQKKAGNHTPWALLNQNSYMLSSCEGIRS